MKITGKLAKVLERQKGISKAGKEWQKQSFVLDTGSDFNNEICIDTFGDKIELILNFVRMTLNGLVLLKKLWKEGLEKKTLLQTKKSKRKQGCPRKKFIR